MKQADRVMTKFEGRCLREREPKAVVVIAAGAEAGGSGRLMEGAGFGEGRRSVSREERRIRGTDMDEEIEGSCGAQGDRLIVWGEMGETGSDLPKNAEDFVVTVSFRLRLMERIDCDSARSNERNERPSSA